MHFTQIAKIKQTYQYTFINIILLRDKKVLIPLYQIGIDRLN